MKIMMLFIIVLVLLDAYVYKAVNGVLGFNSKSPIFWILNLMVYFYFMAVLLGSAKMLPSGATIYIRAFIFIYLFSKLFLLIPLLLEDVVRGFKYLTYRIRPQEDVVDGISRSKFIRNFSIFLASIPLLVLGFGIVRNIYRYKVRKVSLPIADLPEELEGFRIVQISDIHAGTFPQKKPILKGIEMINDLKPDLFVFTGDLVNSVADEIDPYIDYFSQIRSTYGNFSIYGNHDYGDYHEWTSEADKIKNNLDFIEKHKQLNWQLLRNESKIIEVNNAKIAVIGVENYSTIARFPRKGKLDEAIKNTDMADFKVLLSHDPTHWNAEVTTKYTDINLTLSGHTHGFQFGIEIPKWFRWSPSQYIYKQWAGLYQEKEQYIYVNRGFGVLGYPGRVGILPEITLIELKKA